MDYHRIYREFIADRKLRAATLVGYRERHHIVMRHQGGGDEPDNLVNLTPEDHFFAHLVLAKAFDTLPAWSAVMIMVDGRTFSPFSRRARLRYGWARRRYGQLCSERTGASNPNFKYDKISLKRADGTIETRTRSQWNENGIAHAPLCGLLSGKSKSYRGWMRLDTDPADTGSIGRGAAIRKKTKYQWRHLDGRAEHLSPSDLADKYKLRSIDLHAVANGHHTHCAGWHIEGRNVGWDHGRVLYQDDRLHVLVHQDGRIISGTQKQLAGQHGLAQQDVSALVGSQRMSAHGWMTKAVADAGYTPRKWTPRKVEAQLAA